MAKPRVFVSSTYYDLRHIRASLENFIEELGYEPVLSEKGDIAFSPDIPLDESCYREVANVDILVLIVGGRYGSEASHTKEANKQTLKEFYARYESITKLEFTKAIEQDIPVYVLIETAVYSEYQTFTKNQLNQSIVYAHVDSIGVFQFIQELLSLSRNNPVHRFERFAEIESWLRDQWAGLFREFLSQKSTQRQISGLGTQVSDLTEITTTLRKYLEQIFIKLDPSHAPKVIEIETGRLDEAKAIAELSKNPFIQYSMGLGLTVDHLLILLKQATTQEEFLDKLTPKENINSKQLRFINIITSPTFRQEISRDINLARTTVGCDPFPDSFSFTIKPSPHEVAAPIPNSDMPLPPKPKRKRIAKKTL